MTNWNHEIEEKLSNFEQPPSRNTLKAQASRKQFIHAAEFIATQADGSEHKRSWLFPQKWFKEAFPMKLTTIFVIITLLLGGSGISIAAAQSTLPGELLYPLKLVSEDIQYNLSNSDDTRVELALKFANRRYVEIQQLLEAGLMPPDPVIVRWQNQLLSAMQKALHSEDQITQLIKVKDELQLQSQKMNQLKFRESFEPLVHQFQQQMKYQIGLVEAGINDPEKLNKELQWMFTYQQQLKNSEDANQWQWMFKNQIQGERFNFQYQWQYQTQRNESTDSGQLNQNQNQENNQNNIPSNDNSQNNNNEQEQNGDGGSNGSQNGTQNNGGSGGNSGGGGK